MPLQSGGRLGPYEILVPIGAGGMGEVYKARDTRLGREVAIKTIHDGFKAQLQTEARAISALNHPNICTVYDVGPNFLVMELLDGESLAATLHRGPLSLQLVLRYGSDIASALIAAHRQGVVHRDLKPSNIMLTKNGLKVLDFGLAKMLQNQASAGADPADANTITSSNIVMGTPAYIAPEQALGKKVDARADLFSLGVVLYEMATGERPFQGDTSVATIDAILHTDPAPAHVVNSTITPALSSIIAKSLAKNPADRYQSAAAVQQDLQAIQQESNPATGPDTVPKHISKATLLAAAIAIVAVLFSAAWFLAKPNKQSATAPSKRMLAVLPFQNIGADVSKEYFSDGLTEELITAISRLEPDRLGVIARTSSMYYKGRPIRVDQIGRELGVEYVLEGSVRSAGEKVRATAQLIQTRDQSNMWADTYEVRNEEAMTLQREITRRVARSLAINLLPSRQAALDRASTSDRAAYDDYLNGRYEWNKRTGPALLKAIEYFKSATVHDPGFGAAYAGLASSFDLAATYSGAPHSDWLAEGKSALVRALELDAEMSEAYAARGLMHERSDWDLQAAENDFHRAIELNPGDATAHGWYGELLYFAGRLDESWKQLEIAARLDPMSPAIQSNIGWWYLVSHRYDESVAHNKRLLARWPEFGVSAYVLGLTLDQMQRHAEAVDAYKNALRSMGNAPYVVSGLAYSYAKVGNRTEALKLLAELQPDGKCHPSGATAIVYSALGDRQMTFACIERAIEQHSPLVVYMKVTPQLESLHGDPQFAVLLRRAGLQ